MKRYFFALVCLLAAACSSHVTKTDTETHRGTAAVHQNVTPYDAMSVQLQLTPGQTYLAFMQKQVKPGLDSFVDAIKAEAKAHPNQYSRWQSDLISQKAGVSIRIDANNYFFNVGYGDGSQADDTKSGRSYGIGPTGLESDPSYPYYLKELEKYLKNEPQAHGKFTAAIMKVLTNCDPSGWADLSTDGQIVATDFLAIYTAELDRHLMVKLDPKTHPWEIDLATVTLVSTFNASSGLMPKANQLMVKGIKSVDLENGSILAWDQKGPQGSGIGETRGARKALTGKLGEYEYGKHPDVVKSIEAISGSSKNHDVLQTTFAKMSSQQGWQSMPDGGKALTDAMVSYIEQINSDAQDFK